MSFVAALLLSFISLTLGMGNPRCGFDGWQIEPQCGDIPPISAQSNMVSSGNDLYLILGFNECFNISVCDNFFYSYNTTYKYDTRRNNWEAIPVNNPGNVPGGRAFAGVDITEDDGDIIVYGGAQYNNFFGGAIFYDDLWKYSIEDNEWTQLIPSNPTGDDNVPGGLSLVGLVANEDYVWIFGGFSLFDFSGSNETFRYEFATNTWTKLNTINTPPGRGVFAMEWSQRDDDIFYIYGGEVAGGVVLNRDLWEFDTSTNTWTELTSSNGVVPDAANYGAFAVTRRDDFIMAFGETNDPATLCLTDSIINQAHSLSSDTYIYDNGKWELQDASVFVPGLKRPAYTYNRRRNNVYVYGGVNIVCQPGGPGVDIYNRNMYLLDI